MPSSLTLKLATMLASAIAYTLAAGPLTDARADTTGTPTYVSPYGCIVLHGGAVTRPAGSLIVVRQLFEEQTLGIEQDFLNHQTTLYSLNGAPTADLSDQWSAPTQVDAGLPDLVWSSTLQTDTGVTLANPGDQISFDFSLSLTSAVPEIFNPAIGGEAGQPAFNGPGTVVAGTCTVTAT